MLSNLSKRFSQITKTLRGHARLTPENIDSTLREVRLALLEADVALPVVKEFIAAVKERAIGQEVQGSLTPGQALVGIVHQEMMKMMGGQANHLNLATQPPAVILLVGLQGAGKTTSAGKLIHYLVGQKKKVMTVSCDVYRPAAVEQLRLVAQQAGGEVLATLPDPIQTATQALTTARQRHADILVVDTAGRLAVDQAMMDEVKLLQERLQPIETLYVVDSMAGQDAARTAHTFAQTIRLTGIILTKIDGDARGGAALSAQHVTGVPVKFVGVSEKLDGWQVFDPRRIVDRVLGMGDVVALVEQVQKNINTEQAQQLAGKIRSGQTFDLNDFLSQVDQMGKMGGLQGIMQHLPSQIQQRAGGVDMDRAERDIRRMRGIVHSMTAAERSHPDILKASRKKRIAAGAGVQVQDVNRMLTQFGQMRDMMKQMKGAKMYKMMAGMKNMLGKR